MKLWKAMWHRIGRIMGAARHSYKTGKGEAHIVGVINDARRTR